MKLIVLSRLFLLLALPALLCVSAQTQSSAPAAPAPKGPPTNQYPGLPPRLSPNDYQSHTTLGNVTIAAEFARHAVPTEGNALTTEDYVTVEIAFFGPAESHVQISADDFSLRINGKKNILHSTPFVLVLSSIKDPEWSPPESANPKSKTSLGTGGQPDAGTPAPVKPSFELQRAMAQRTQKASLPLGDKPLPQAGLVFFPYHGKEKSIESVELIYSGAAGKATLDLHP